MDRQLAINETNHGGLYIGVTDRWINFFKDLCDSTMFDPSLSHHINCLRFCFLGLLQSELDETRDLWNNHHIRKTSNSECPAGRPNIWYFPPQISFGINDKLPLADENY